MLIRASTLMNTPVMGLQTGSELARTKDAIIDPRDLTVAAYYLEGPLLENERQLLRIADIRELSNIGMIVDSSEEFVEPEDVIAIQKIIDFDFTMIGISVVDELHHKLGKVIDYTIDPASFTIQQLTVKRPMLKSLSDTELLVNRTQVVEVSNTAIIVRTTAAKPEPLQETVRHYANPFRPPSMPQPESMRRQH